MNKFKVIVYAISKNESKFVDRWYESMKEADDIYVLDTGSTDDTYEKLKEKGVFVKKEVIDPWRFDVARNKSLDMVPIDVDICVCTDLDEVFESGWREKLESVWEKNATRCKYTYNWSLDENNNPIVSFYYEKIHSRKNFKWIYPVHEVLSYDGEENYVNNFNIVLNHFPDSKKSRKYYLDLLELSVKENPNNDRNMHYLGREYMFNGRWNDSIDTLIKHLNLKTSTWKDERCASMRFISRCYKKLGRFEEARMWLNKAILEAPYLRDPYMEKAVLEYELKNYSYVIEYCKKALKINNKTKTYINESISTNKFIYDLIAISYYEINDYEEAYKYNELALLYDPNNERLINNKNVYISKIKEILEVN